MPSETKKKGDELLIGMSFLWSHTRSVRLRDAFPAFSPREEGMECRPSLVERE